ncbi:hypothetical protein [Amycolatopsis sp. NPDC051071]|uniref:hypothetical protein n=1 Tax=Amycolatopsis sp. NPDC051071 TaxID=3154637 RepID=UPI0034146561
MTDADASIVVLRFQEGEGANTIATLYGLGRVWQICSMVFVIQVVPGGVGPSASYWTVLGRRARAARGRLGAKTANEICQTRPSLSFNV